jgi:glycerol-3-phosphate cytidylyltransferase
MNAAHRHRVVYTTGAFDPFHFGHLNILRQARAIAETLIVGVSTDELIRQAKGREPFMSLEQRMAIIAELRCVDRVIPQIDKNKQRIVDELKVDAIVVGSDWRGRYPPVSCALVYFDYTEGISSSLLRREQGERDGR